MLTSLKNRIKETFSTSNPFFLQSKSYYKRYERFVPLASFFAGFSWDSLTLTRIDRLLDNMTLLLYLSLLIAAIIIMNLVEKQVVTKGFFVRHREWLPIAVQFLLGGLFSAYVIFYFQSASFTKSSIFLIILVILLVSNEFLKERLTNIYLQISLIFLSGFSFFIFFIPVITAWMNVFTFIAGALLSAFLAVGCLYYLYRRSALKSTEQFWRLLTVIGGLFLTMNLLYFFNWIPPIPLSVKEAGVYHHVSKKDDHYIVRYQAPKWYEWFRRSDKEFLQAPGDSIFCYASIFAPTALKTEIFHEWNQYLPEKEQWQTTDRVRYNITGGRQGGYRGFSFKRHIKPGQWEINIETADGILLSTVNFTVAEIADTSGYQLIEEIRR